jgi:lysophospholipase L1-like esterase
MTEKRITNKPAKTISLKKKIVFSCIIIMGFAGFMETFASIYYHVNFTEQERQELEVLLGLQYSNDHSTIRYIPHPYFNYVLNPQYRFPDGYRPYNSKGFREPEWPTTKKPETIRIVALGGSTTYGMLSRDGKDVWPAFLEGILADRLDMKFEVINLGIPAYTAHEIIGVLAMLVPTLSPDIILIHIGGNDAFTAAYPDEGGADNVNFRYPWRVTPPPEILTFMMRKSLLFRLAGMAFFPSVKGSFPGDIVAAMQYPSPPESQVLANSPRATGKYFRQNVKTLIALSQSIDAIPVLLTHPLHPKWESPTDSFYKVVVNAHRRNNNILLEVGSESNVLVVDLYAQMQNPQFFIDALHASPQGMAKKSLLVAEEIESLVVSSLLSSP